MRLELEENPDGSVGLVLRARISQLAEAAQVASALETLCGGSEDAESSRQAPAREAAAPVDAPEYPATAQKGAHE